MKEGRGRILICRTMNEKVSQKSTVEKVLEHLSSISKKQGGEAADKRAEELIKIIDSATSEEEILKALQEVR